MEDGGEEDGGVLESLSGDGGLVGGRRAEGGGGVGAAVGKLHLRQLLHPPISATTNLVRSHYLRPSPEYLHPKGDTLSGRQTSRDRRHEGSRKFGVEE